MPSVAMADQLSEHYFGRLAGIIESHSGIRMPSSKRTMVEGRLRKRVRVLGLPDIDAYCRHLFDENGLDGEFVHLIDAVTTNKTDFFREPEHFTFLTSTAVPTLLGSRGGEQRRLKLWSAACSNGAEAYTMAMALGMMDPRFVTESRFAILGTDISTEVVEQAVAAIYPNEMLATVPPGAQRYIMRARDSSRRQFRIVPELRRLTRFRRMNLMDTSYPVDRDVDVIFCRNILIYFDKPTQGAVLERLCSHLRPGGFLFLGHSESMAGTGMRMRQVAPTVFRRQ